MKKNIEKIEIFNSFVSHEIKSALASTKAYTELVERAFQKEDTKKAKEYSQKMKNQLEKVIYLFSTAMDAQRVSQDTYKMVKETFDIVTLLQESIVEIKKNDQSIILHGPNICNINADRTLLKKVILSLLDNALLYSSSSKNITITLQKASQKQIQIIIEDEGSGIPNEYHAKIFTPFFKLETSQGLGLSLFIAREIIKAHEGTLDMLTSSPQGTSFSLIMPLT